MALDTAWRSGAVVVGYPIVGIGIAVGRIERGDPIPPGVYWLDLIHGKAQNGVDRRENFVFWQQANPGKIRVIRTIEHEPASSIDIRESDASLTWVLFEVLEPVNRWGNDTGLGLPTVAPRGVDTEEDDVIDRGIQADTRSWWLRETLGIPNPVLAGGVVLLGAVATYAWVRR